MSGAELAVAARSVRRASVQGQQDVPVRPGAVESEIRERSLSKRQALEPRRAWEGLLAEFSVEPELKTEPGQLADPGSNLAGVSQSLPPDDRCPEGEAVSDQQAEHWDWDFDRALWKPGAG
jgi:hypothetical protein